MEIASQNSIGYGGVVERQIYNLETQEVAIPCKNKLLSSMSDETALSRVTIFSEVF